MRREDHEEAVRRRAAWGDALWSHVQKIAGFALAALAPVLAGTLLEPRTLWWLGVLALVGLVGIALGWRGRRKRVAATRAGPGQEDEARRGCS